VPQRPARLGVVAPARNESKRGNRRARSRRPTMGVRAMIGAWMSTVLAAWAPIQAQEPQSPQPPHAAVPQPEGGEESPAKAVSRLVEQLRRHPVKPTTAADRIGLHLIDVTSGEVTLIADQPDPGLTQCGSPMWSNDGWRIV